METMANASKKSTNYSVLIYIALSSVVSLNVAQTEALEVGTFSYWVLIAIGLVFPVLYYKRILQSLLGPAIPLTIFLAVSGLWSLGHLDIAAFRYLVLLIGITAWLSSNRVDINVSHLSKLYIFLVILGAIFSIAVNDYSRYGVIPGQSDPVFGAHRVSFFPNIGITGIYSLAMVLVLTVNREIAQKHRYALAVCVYFAVFSFVRTALIGILVYIALYFLYLRLNLSPLKLFLSSIFSAVAINLLVLYAPLYLGFLQNFELTSLIFTQGKTGLSQEELYAQIYRGLLWIEHLKIFESSPYLMGIGTFDFRQLVFGSNNPYEAGGGGTESFFTRLLAIYGIPSFLLLYFFLKSFWKSCKARDLWAAAAFPSITLVMMSWGSAFHPTDALFVIYMLILIKGRDGFNVLTNPKRNIRARN